MSEWSAGYVVDIDYTHGFYKELTPSYLNFCALMQGIQGPDLTERSLAYCELGCGLGFTTNLLAAANPHIQFYANDFNPVHIIEAKALAQSAQSTNVHFFDDSFADFLNRKDLPDFDFITLHGIYSWISVENRQVIVEFIRKKLKPGGLVYISYNCMPGWASVMPLRRLLGEVASNQGPSTPLQSRISASIDFVSKLESLNSSYFANSPRLPTHIEHLKKKNQKYIAHEYFGQHMTPFYFMDVAQELAEAKLTWVGSASALETLDNLNLTKEQKQFLSEIGNRALRETVRDHILDQPFRKDIFVKGSVPLSSSTLREKWMETRFVAVHKSKNIPRQIKGLRFSANLNDAIYNPLAEALEQGPRSLRELQMVPALEQLGREQIIEAITFLVAGGHVQPCLPEQNLAERQIRTDLFNKAVAEHAQREGKYSYFASAVTGGGIAAKHIAQLIWLAKSQQKKDAPHFIWDLLRQTGQLLSKEGKSLETEEENLAGIRELLTDFDENTADIWKAHKIDASFRT